MNWASWSDFFSMRGYGLYVWGSYAVTAALMLAEPWLVVRHRHQALRSAAEPQEASS
jgi:heme exporter protein D